MRLVFALFLACAVALGGAARAQDQTAPFKPEEIEALVAPIALYPDDLLSQVLMASTYPLEIVQAARWVKANPNVKGDAAVKAVENQSWDVSVKSLVAFPQVLEPMNEKLDWTQKLGDAFLADQKSVLDAVQRLRVKAEQSGNLKSTEQQKVVVQQEAQQTIIQIVPADPQVIYVPAYNPTVVYGAWGYPAYPPYYWPPSPVWYPGGYLAAGFAWGVGLAAAGAIFGNCNWGHGNVNVNVNRVTNIDRNYNRTNVGSGGKWQHDASHRKGVSYRDNASRERYSKGVGGAEGRRDYRGREGAAGQRPAGDRASASQRPAGDRAGASQRPAGERRGASDRQRAGTSDRRAGADRGGGRDNAFSGVGGGSASQRDFDRGRASNQSMSGNRGSAGASSRSSGASRGGGATLVITRNIATTLLAALAIGWMPATLAQQKAFATPEAAMDAFGDAVARSDGDEMKTILGKDYRTLIPPVGAEIRYRFLENWAKQHAIKPEGDAKAAIAVGSDGWTLPIPLVKTAQGWRFDTRAGADEIRIRHIGRNELAVMKVMLAIYDAQREYASKDRSGDGVLEYASKFRSSPGKRDGLYWPTKSGEPESPLGPAVAAARAAGGSRATGYYGYHYKILKSQGKDAPGGAFDYVAHGRMIGGFAVVAWPVRYGETGVMTFIVNHTGVLYQKDLGPRSAAIAGAMTRFDPDSGWEKVQPGS